MGQKLNKGDSSKWLDVLSSVIKAANVYSRLPPAVYIGVIVVTVLLCAVAPGSNECAVLQAIDGLPLEIPNEERETGNSIQSE